MLLIIFTLNFVLFLSNCGPTYNSLNNQEKKLVFGVNSVISDINYVKTSEESPESFFSIYSNTHSLEQSEILLFAQQPNSANQISNTATISRLIKNQDTILIPGGEPQEKPRFPIAQELSLTIFASREQEILISQANTSFEKINNIKNNYLKIFINTKSLLNFDLLNLKNTPSYYWGLDYTKSDFSSQNLEIQNMIKSIRDRQKNTAHIFVLAPAKYVPLYEFAHTLNKWQQEANNPNSSQQNLFSDYQNFSQAQNQEYLKLGSHFYEFCSQNNITDTCFTQILYEFLSNQDSHSQLVPKNISDYKNIEKFLEN